MSELSEAYREYGELMLKNMDYRSLLYDGMNKFPEAAQIEYRLCSKDYGDEVEEDTGIIRFFNNHLWTHETRPHILRAYGDQFINNPTLPFILYDYQREGVTEICEAIDNGHDILIDKSRDMGVTWLIIGGVFLWYWLFKKGSDLLAGSRKFDYVDKKGATDTLFEKFRYNLYRLQPQLFPRKFDINKHDNVGFIQNPSNGNFLRGEANNPNFATSGRYLAIFADEFSKWEETDESAWTSMGDSSPCRIAVSTPYGIGRKFGRLRHSEEIKVLSFEWTRHPIKSAGKYRGQHPYLPEKGEVWLSEWYLYECERRKGNPSADIGQELDIDYLSSGMPYFNNTRLKEKFLGLEKNMPKIERLDFTRTGDDLLEVEPRPAGRIQIARRMIGGWTHRYCIAADVAEGRENGDKSEAVVFDRVTLEDVALFSGHIDTDVFALLLQWFGVEYGNAYIAVENNNHGHAVLQKLKTLYSYLMHEQNYGAFVDMENMKLGWNTNVATRPILFGDLREALSIDAWKTFDLDFYNQCMTLVYNRNGKVEADSGCLDDKVIVQGIKWQIHKWLPAPQQKEPEAAKMPEIERFGGWPTGENRKDVRNIWIT